MRLTEHFTLEEFTRSATAQAHGIDNTVPPELIPNIQNLCIQVLEPLRRHIGKPIIISSGYRCPKLNQLVGGAKDSQHLKGEAADIHLPSIEEGRDWFLWLMDNTCFDQLIWERKGQSRWIHVSCRIDQYQNRQQVFHLTKK